MTQIIWYRKETAPKDAKPAPPPAEWEKTQPAADFITIAPDHLREAFWHKIARPVQGIMYHGWASMEAGDSHGAYKFTDGRAKEALTQLTRDVARPLGPMLLQVPDRPADVAILQSFASQIFAGRGTLGWSAGWDADIHLVLQWAQIQPRILYEETVLRDGLNGIKVLVLANCDVLPQSVFDKIKAWQKTGGVVVGDTALTPAVVPDILLTPYLRTRKAEKDKAALQAMAGRLRQELDAFYTRYAESSNPDVITRTRRYGETDYVFAINDKRVFGGYVGHHGLVMEDGVAASATMTLRRPGAVVYDPLARVQVKTQTVAGATQWQVDLGPGEGRVYLVTPRPIASVVIRPPEGARLGGKAAVGVAVLDDRGQPVPAVLPLRVDVLDPQGRAAEFSGFYGARDGRLSLELDLAVNDLAGQWKVKVVDLASGLSQEAAFGVAALAGK